MDRDALPVTLRGPALLRNPALNKGSAFTLEERHALGLMGLLPPHVSTLEEQVARVVENFRSEPTPLDKYNYLRLLQDRNETLFFAVLARHLEEMAPIIYTPTVAEAVRRFSHIFRTTRGLYITPDNVDHIDAILSAIPGESVAVIVCTDNEGILGIGDQGVGGIGIPIGKLALYVAAGGFAPGSCLPISLDVGTDNEELLRDPLYIGLRRRRLADEEYAAFIEAFVNGVRRCCPRAVLQWEDFSRDRACDNLRRYRGVVPSFNDDIQGTAAVVHAALLGALKLAGRDLTGETICVVGAGAAGVGVARGLTAALVARGLSGDEAHARVLCLDSQGLVVQGRPGLPPYKQGVAADPEVVRGWRGASAKPGLGEVIEFARPGVLIGLSGQPGAFPRGAIERMAVGCDRPAIFALSNPSANVEAHPHDLVRWTEGRAIVATGSPFEPLDYEGRTYHFSQVNNVYVFPGIGVGTHLSGARVVSDGMLVAAAQAVHAAVGPDDLARGVFLPPLGELRPVAAKVAAAVMCAAAAEGVAPVALPGEVERTVEDWQYVPRYRRYVPA